MFKQENNLRYRIIQKSFGNYHFCKLKNLKNFTLAPSKEKYSIIFAKKFIFFTFLCILDQLIPKKKSFFKEYVILT